MEALETDDAVLPRILAALDAPGRVNADPDAQIDTLMRAAEGRGGDRPVTREPIVDRRHVVHRGRRVGTLTRNGGQWVFRFATTIGEDVVQALADRIGDLVAEVEAQFQKAKPPL